MRGWGGGSRGTLGKVCGSLRGSEAGGWRPVAKQRLDTPPPRVILEAAGPVLAKGP